MPNFERHFRDLKNVFKIKQKDTCIPINVNSLLPKKLMLKKKKQVLIFLQT